MQPLVLLQPTSLMFLENMWIFRAFVITLEPYRRVTASQIGQKEQENPFSFLVFIIIIIISLKLCSIYIFRCEIRCELFFKNNFQTLFLHSVDSNNPIVLQICIAIYNKHLKYFHLIKELLNTGFFTFQSQVSKYHANQASVIVQMNEVAKILPRPKQFTPTQLYLKNYSHHSALVFCS